MVADSSEHEETKPRERNRAQGHTAAEGCPGVTPRPHCFLCLSTTGSSRKEGDCPEASLAHQALLLVEPSWPGSSQQLEASRPWEGGPSDGPLLTLGGLGKGLGSLTSSL
jgi:hypothetical protein